MTDPTTYAARAHDLSETLQARLGVRGRGLERRLRRAGRRLPRHVRRAGQEIVEAGRLMGHPKLSRLVDPAGLDAAFDTVNGHLKGVNRAEARRNALLNLAASIVFNLMVLGLGIALLVQVVGPI